MDIYSCICSLLNSLAVWLLCFPLSAPLVISENRYKVIEFIDLHSIFKDILVITSIPNYFNNSETPIICYKYNKPIRSTIFNFNEIVNDIDIDSNTPAF